MIKDRRPEINLLLNKFGEQWREHANFVTNSSVNSALNQIADRVEFAGLRAEIFQSQHTPIHGTTGDCDVCSGLVQVSSDAHLLKMRE